uniref:tRNA-queuosine alpha-mannosyltransferase n=1 Tax=Macrostomum lignano TaxID=282301 RepID=A0A1I8FBB5_9PLAT
PNASMSTQPLVLIIEPFYGGSHRQLIDYLTGEILPPGCWHLVAMTAKKWHWRARCSALHVAQQVAEAAKGHLFCSSVLSLAELVGLCPCLAATKKLVYFHENQLVYPVRKMRGERDFQYGYNQILTALAADLVLFNSRHNMDTFLHGIDSFLNAMPDYRTRGLGTGIAAKSQILYLPIVPLASLADGQLEPKRCSATLCDLDTQKQRSIQQQQQPQDWRLYSSHHRTLSSILIPSVPSNQLDNRLLILWPHRWEHDKNPDSFFTAIFALADSGETNFALCILGQSFAGPPPPAFEAAKKRLPSDQIAHWGYLENRQAYLACLSACHVVVSTAEHEFFGLAMLEATSAGCYPLAPRRLAYPELFPSDCLYNTDTQLVKRLRWLCRGGPGLARRLRAEGDFQTRLDRLKPEALPQSAAMHSGSISHRKCLHKPSWPERPDNFTGDDFLEDLKRNLYVKRQLSKLTVVVATGRVFQHFCSLCLFVQAYCLMLQGTLAPETVLFGLGMLAPPLYLAYLFCASAALTNPICHLCEL